MFLLLLNENIAPRCFVTFLAVLCHKDLSTTCMWHRRITVCQKPSSHRISQSRCLSRDMWLLKRSVQIGRPSHHAIPEVPKMLGVLNLRHDESQKLHGSTLKVPNPPVKRSC